MNVPELNEQTFHQLLGSTKPVEIHGFIPKKPGTTKSEYSTDPCDVSDTFKHNLNDPPLRWFSLDPIFFALGENRVNLLKDFVDTPEGKNAFMVTYDLPYPIFAELLGHRNRVSAVDKEHWDQFLMFLAPIVFTKKDTWWMINSAEHMVAQPKFEDRFCLTVFTPVGVDVGVYSFIGLDGLVHLYQGGGNPLVSMHATQYGNKTRSFENGG